MQFQVIWIPACADVALFFFYPPSLFPLAFSPLVRLLLARQLRSAGAAVIQELLPRVSSIGTLDLSDNGISCRPQAQDAPVSPPIMNCVTHWIYLLCLSGACACVRVSVFVWTGLDADLLAVLPALSRHPSLKHLHLGKNFNIKNRCSRRLASLQCARVCACVLL